MNQIAIGGNTGTMSSDELLEIINTARADAGEPPIRRNKLAVKIEDELEGSHCPKRVVQNLNNTESTVYDLTRDQCMLVSMRESKAVRRRVVHKLNTLESGAVVKPMTQLETARMLVSTLELNEQQAARLEISEPKAEALDLLCGQKGSLCLRDAAKTLNWSPGKFYTWMRANRWIYKQSDEGQYKAYQPRQNSGFMEMVVVALKREGRDDKMVEQARVTALGMAKLAQTIGQQP